MMLGIIGAMKEEVHEVLNLMQISQESTLHGYHFYQGTLAGLETVVVQGGVGKVNATISTTLMILNFDVTHIINIGSAGGLKREQEVGDIVIGEKVVHHDVDVLGFGYAYGEVPGMPIYYEADQQLVAYAKEALRDTHHTVHMGLIASGDQFVHEQRQVDQIMTYFPESMCCEMEAGAVAQTCHVLNKPFIITRGLSDIFGKGNNMVQFDTYLKEAAINSAKMCYKVAESLAR